MTIYYPRSSNAEGLSVRRRHAPLQATRYRRLERPRGVEPPSARFEAGSIVHYAKDAYMVLPVGDDPTTSRLRAGCSAY